MKPYLRSIMFNRNREETHLESALERALTELDRKAVGTAEYDRVLENVVKLHEMKEAEKPSKVSKDTWAIIGANLAGIVLVINAEHVGVITTKAFSFVGKIR